MPRNKLEATAALMKKIGSIKPDKEPVTYDAAGRSERLERRQRDGEVIPVIPGARAAGEPGIQSCGLRLGSRFWVPAFRPAPE